MTRISIALCTYNGEHYLSEQLQSYLEQTRLPYELVACDDGSTDNTVSLLEAFAQTAPFQVRVICNPENLGYTKNFEKAISLCEGDLIALSDQDDVWLPEKLAWCAEIFEQHPEVSLVFTDAQVVDNTLQALGYTLWEALDFPSEQRRQFTDDAFNLQLMRNHVTGATIMLRAEEMPQVLPFPDNWIHDDWIATIMSAYTRLMLIDRPTMLYRQHPNNQVGIEPAKQERDDIYAEKLPLLQRMRRRQQHQDRLSRKIRAHLYVMIVHHLRERQRAMRLSDTMLEKVTSYTRHVRARSYLPRSRWVRLAVILKEVLTRRYQRFSPGGILPFGLSIALADMLWNDETPTTDSRLAKVRMIRKDGQGLEFYNSPPPKV